MAKILINEQNGMKFGTILYIDGKNSMVKKNLDFRVNFMKIGKKIKTLGKFINVITFFVLVLESSGFFQHDQHILLYNLLVPHFQIRIYFFRKIEHK